MEPAIKGTVNVLKAAKEAGVERVVATSSVSAIIPSPQWPADKIKGEDCWTDLDYCKQKGVSAFSITLTYFSEKLSMLKVHPILANLFQTVISLL